MVHKIHSRKLNQIVRHFFPLTLLIIMFVIAGSRLVAFQQNASPSSLTTPTPTRSPSPHTTYTSSKLGISFAYKPVIPNGIGQYFFIKEIGDTIYLYWVPGVNQPFTGTDAEFFQKIAPGSKYVKVFAKNPNQSLVGAIKQQHLTGYSENDCFVQISRYGHPRVNESYQTAIIGFPYHPNQSRRQTDASIKKCPEYATTPLGVSYFMMDPQHPNKLLFIKYGQDNLPSGVGGSTWDGTIKVLE